jgi:iron complex outermembrane recepter protein
MAWPRRNKNVHDKSDRRDPRDAVPCAEREQYAVFNVKTTAGWNKPRAVPAVFVTALGLGALLVALVFQASVARAQAETPAAPAAMAAGQPGDEQGRGVGGKNPLLNLDVDQLASTPVVTPSATPSTALSMDAPVTTVTKEQSTVGHSAAAVFVITPEMIRRSGATCIPEALRMVPGMDVAKIDSNMWAISCRGFNSRYANKLLVLIDGRTVYNPVFSGVYWDTQDVLMEDIERIEVVRGPGGTLWGSNAVNGVINVITKRANDTQGGYASAGGGTYERFMGGARYGGELGENGYYRVYGKDFERGPGYEADGSINDAWRQGRVGFRCDWDLDRARRDSLTVQGDYYTGVSSVEEQFVLTVPPFAFEQAGHDRVTGENVLARWRHACHQDSDWTLQVYYDKYQRDSFYRMESAKTYDLDFQYRFLWTERQTIICGARYRHIDTDYIGADPFTIYFDPPRRGLNYTNQYVQDQIALVVDRLDLYLGVGLEQNVFTGLECLPNARLLWTLDEKHSAWGAISRAVRTPSIVENDIVGTGAPSHGVFPRIYGSPSTISEDLMAYEIGYREQTTDRFSWDLATFYNVYDNLGTVAPGQIFVETIPPPPHLVLPLTSTNGPRANAYGVELATNSILSERWRIYSQYTFFAFRSNTPSYSGEGVSPRNQVYMRSSWDLTKKVEFDLTGRYVDCLEAIAVPSYITMDLRLAWRPRRHWELAVVGQNLLQDHHLEFGRTVSTMSTEVSEVVRGVYGTLTWRH